MALPKGQVQKRRKFILTIGDDGGILVYMQGKKVLRRMYAASPSPQDVKHLESLFQGDQKAPVYLLADTMDQAYVQQTLPPVSSLNINKLIQRRLERDFDRNDLKGALPLGRQKEGRRDWNYLFIAVPNTPPLSQWMEVVLSLPNPFKGLYLLPVEAQRVAMRLRDLCFTRAEKKKQPLITLTKPKEDAAQPKSGDLGWHVFVSHNKVGGFRQVVMRDGKLVFTRLAQPIGESRPDVIAGNIEQELSNTLEYLKRLSFNPGQGLEISIIVADEIRRHLSLQRTEARQIVIQTPHEASEKLGFVKATEEDDSFGDVVLAAGFGAQARPLLRFATPEMDRQRNLYAVQQAATLGAGVVAPLALIATAFVVAEIVSLNQDVNFAEKNKREAEGRMAQLRDASQELPADIDRINDIVSLHKALMEHQVNPLKMVSKFSELLNEQTLVDGLDWSTKTPFPKSEFKAVPGNDATTRVEFVVNFLENEGSINAFLARTEDFLQRMKALFPDYKVDFSDLPEEIVGSQDIMSIDFAEGGVKRQLTSRDVSLRYTLSGPLPKEGEKGAEDAR